MGFQKLQQNSAVEREKRLTETPLPIQLPSQDTQVDVEVLDQNSQTDEVNDLVYRGPFASGRAGVSDYTFKAWLEKIGTNQRTLINTSVFEKARIWIEWLPDAISNYYNSHFR